MAADAKARQRLRTKGGDMGGAGRLTVAAQLPTAFAAPMIMGYKPRVGTGLRLLRALVAMRAAHLARRPKG